MTQQPARTVYCGKGLSAAELDGYHVMHQHVAEFFLTESVFPAGFHVPKHIHSYHCIYLVLDDASPKLISTGKTSVSALMSC